ncbi:hypothetical protein LDL08_42260 [Nonomuraea glycinis]|uniref:Uncharacterized protein n=1 Tax=Nonomuraea glycinis TaxID=2047744 RepID=A0A918EAG3_9ACTN|nr:hypothetical protein [Nonomuraea glycinis]MCA2182804.1 hypothetical protein [Nonomuraea glycinis]GGP17159.1 hypothetical protein GCM10012278_83870 [Nonomuraea glycinis]
MATGSETVTVSPARATQIAVYGVAALSRPGLPRTPPGDDPRRRVPWTYLLHLQPLLHPAADLPEDGLVSGEAGLYGADEVEKLSTELVRVRKGRFVLDVSARHADGLERIVAGALRALG